jgi:hypothetical protein
MLYAPLYKGRFPLRSLCPRAGVKNNERFARAGKADVNGKRPLEGLALDHDELCPSQFSLALSYK